MANEATRPGRCGAKTRSGNPCKSWPVKGKRRCRMHGGAKGIGGQPGNKNAWKHGQRSAETVRLRKQINAMVREAKRAARELV